MDSTAIEEWRAVPGYEGHYEVSDHGRVRSLDRVVVDRKDRTLRCRGRVLRPGTNRYGYQYVSLSKGGTGKTVTVHRLVTAAFIGPRPVGLDVMHADDNPANNHLSNLSYGTTTENVRQCVDRGRNRNTQKTHCPDEHPYDGDNLYVSSDGKRHCRECRRSAGRAYMRRKRADTSH